MLDIAQPVVIWYAVIEHSVRYINRPPAIRIETMSVGTGKIYKDWIDYVISVVVVTPKIECIDDRMFVVNRSAYNVYFSLDEDRIESLIDATMIALT